MISIDNYGHNDDMAEPSAANSAENAVNICNDVFQVQNRCRMLRYTQLTGTVTKNCYRICRKQSADGIYVGRKHQNPILDSIEFFVEFPDGNQMDVGAYKNVSLLNISILKQIVKVIHTVYSRTSQKNMTNYTF